MKKIIYRLSLVAAVLGMVSCSNDMEKVYVLPSAGITLGGASEDIVLTPDNPEALALTLYWEADDRPDTSNPAIDAPLGAAVKTIELSPSQNFENTLEIAVENNTRSYQFLREEFNALLGRLDYVAGTLSPLWIRIRSSLGANMEPEYSNALCVNVSTYRISLERGSVLDKDGNVTDMVLASPEENGVYTGFMGVSGWYNWWFREANNVVWGNNGDTGIPFEASSAASHWNFWFPDPAGCYYVTLNTVEGWWNALHIDNLSIGGAIETEMSFNQKANVWTATLQVPSAGNYTLSLTGQGSLYDVSTTDMGPAVPYTVTFGGDATNLDFFLNASNSTFDVTLAAGEVSIVLDLSNPQNITFSMGDAPEIPDSVEEYLYVGGQDDGLTGEGWNLDSYLTLYDESTQSYAAVLDINSLWGWMIYRDKDWGGALGTDSTDPYQGNLVEGGGNIPVPDPGQYLVDVSLESLTYSLAEVTEVWYTGLNDDWSLAPMTLVEGCIYEAEVEKYAETPWGVKILLRDDWSMWFGGADGILRYGWDGFDGDNSLPAGTYILRVDLSAGTYQYISK